MKDDDNLDEDVFSSNIGKDKFNKEIKEHMYFSEMSGVMISVYYLSIPEYGLFWKIELIP